VTQLRQTLPCVTKLGTTSSRISMFSCSNWSILFFCLHGCCRCELALGEDVGPLSLTEVDRFFLRKSKVWGSDLWNYECGMMLDVYEKWTVLFYFQRIFKSSCKHHKEPCFINNFKRLQSAPFLKAKNGAKEHTYDVYNTTYLNPSTLNGKKNYECMHAWLCNKNIENMV